jgi:hypothetical protein
MTISRSILYRAYIVVLLTTEFYLVDFLGGSLRFAHLGAPLITLLLIRDIPKIAKSGVFWTLLAFLAVNLAAAACASAPADALFSFGLLAANTMIAISVALILASGRIRFEELMRLLLHTALAGIAFGLVQVVCYRAGGIDLSLSESQQQQLAGGFASGLRYEANAFAKNLNVVFLLWLPVLLSRGKGLRKALLGLALVVGMLLSLTRSANYGLAITLAVIYCWHLLSARGKPISPRLLILLGLAIGAVAMFSAVVDDFNAYASRKLQLFFDSDELLRGDSSSFRFMGQAMLWNAFTADEQSLLIGTGWGQVKFFAFDRIYQAGGAELIVVLGYGGVLGGLTYLLLHLGAIRSARRAIDAFAGDRRIPQGIFFAQLGILVTGQINGSLIAPEYWLLFGMSIALAHGRRPEVAVQKPIPPVRLVGSA